jgi:hypothetical protein
LQKPLAQSPSFVQGPLNGQGAQVDPLELELEPEPELDPEVDPELELPVDPPVELPLEPGLEQAADAERPVITINSIHALFLIRTSPSCTAARAALHANRRMREGNRRGAYFARRSRMTNWTRRFASRPAWMRLSPSGFQ